MFKFRKPKSVYSILVLTILALFLLFPVSYADDSISTVIDKGSTEEIDKGFIIEIDKTNSTIDKLISAAQDAAQQEIIKAEDKEAKHEDFQDKIEKIEAKLNIQIEKICDRLVDKTDKEAQQLINKAEREGIEIISEYIVVEVGGKFVTVDPFYAH